MHDDAGRAGEIVRDGKMECKQNIGKVLDGVIVAFATHGWVGLPSPAAGSQIH
jgi:hypothetical protein